MALTTVLGDVVFALRHREVGLADAILAVKELADDAVRVVWATCGSDGERTAGRVSADDRWRSGKGAMYQVSLGWAMRASDATARARTPKVDIMVLVMDGCGVSVNRCQLVVVIVDDGTHSQVCCCYQLGLAAGVRW